MDSDTQLRLATRIHYALLRYLGTGIDVGSMLSRKSYAREVIYVCVGCSDPELNTLAQEFMAARKAARGLRPMPLVDKKVAPATIPMLPITAVVPIEPGWSENSSLFGSSQQNSGSDDAPEPEPKRRFDPIRWLRRESRVRSR